MEAVLAQREEKDGVVFYHYHFRWSEKNASADDEFQFSWEVPMQGAQYLFMPNRGMAHIQPDWSGEDTVSMITSGCPLSCLYNGRGENQFCYSLSECKKLIFYHTGVLEETGGVVCRFRFGVFQYTNETETDMVLRVDTRPLPIYETIGQVASWWAHELGMTPAEIPECAKDPLYSFWYSYHQEVYEKDVEEECRRAYELGFRTCIVDDGWQTGDNNRGYAYCGDWKPAHEKISDMAAHVKRVHELGMKYILWYSVVFIGFHSENYTRFKGKYLYEDKNLKASVLDPRYKEVRTFLTELYKTALTEWDLDGFKLDFVDCWRPDASNPPYNPDMDIASLPEACEAFFRETVDALKAVKPDILLEFRQGYMGPVMRMYGNMFRVGDCPAEYISNRVGIFQLRMTMGSTAVHSDMLTWHPMAVPEIAALQIISVLFGTLQYSARLDEISEDCLKMSRFWIRFMQEHRDLLQSESLKCCDPHVFYSWAQASDADTTIAAVYIPDKVISPEKNDRIYIANGAESDRILTELSGEYRATVWDCYGNQLSSEDRTFNGITALAVPVSGLVLLEK